LVAERETADYFEEVAEGHDPKLAANWVITNLFGALNKRGLGIAESPVSAPSLSRLLDLLKDGTISGRIAKEVFEIMLESGAEAAAIVEEKGLKQITDSGEIEAVIDRVTAANPDKVEDIRGGKEKLLGWFTGQVMKETEGKANPQAVNSYCARRFWDKGARPRPVIEGYNIEGQALARPEQSAIARRPLGAKAKNAERSPGD